MEPYVVVLGVLALLGLSSVIGVLEVRAQRKALRALTTPTPATVWRQDRPRSSRSDEENPE